MTSQAKSDKDIVLSLLHKLAISDLQEVSSQAKGLLNHRNAGPASDGVFVLDVMREVLAHNGIEFPNLPRVRSSSDWTPFAEKSEDVMLFIRTHIRETNKQRAMLKMGICLLYNNLCSMNVPISARTVMRQIHRVPAVINRAFPGYAVCGLLHVVVKG